MKKFYEWATGKKAKATLDCAKTYLRLQFLTPAMKAKKDAKIHQLRKKYESHSNTVIPYEGSFEISFECVLNLAELDLNGQLPFSKLIIELQVPRESSLKRFLQDYVHKVEGIQLNNNMLAQGDTLPLFNQFEVSVYTPSEIVQVIYTPKSLWDRIKLGTKNVIKAIPNIMYRFLSRIAQIILSSLGFGEGLTGVLWKFIPLRRILQVIIYILTLFFPFLAPFIYIGKLAL